MKLSKIKIEELANEIKDFVLKNDYETDVIIYFNNKRMSFDSYDNNWNRLEEPQIVIWENVSPLDYFKYANARHILSMSFEGSMYDELNYGNGRVYSKLQAIFEKYDLYFEPGNAWNLTAYPNTKLEYSDIEYTDYQDKVKKKPICIGYGQEDCPDELIAIMKIWYDLSGNNGDKGCCVLGAGFNFNFKGEKYFMRACSPYQGSLSWERYIGVIQEMLENINATEINYNWGAMD